MDHVINFNNVDKASVREDGVTLHFNGGGSMPFFREEAQQIKSTLQRLADRQSGWFNIRGNEPYMDEGE